MSLKKKSFSLIEVVFACGILIMFLAAGILITKGALRNAATNKDRLQAAMFANRIIEEVRAARDSVFFAGEKLDWGKIAERLALIFGVDIFTPNAEICFSQEGEQIKDGDDADSYCHDEDNVFYVLTFNLSEINLAGTIEKLVVNASWNDFGISKDITIPTYFMGCQEGDEEVITEPRPVDVVNVIDISESMEEPWKEGETVSKINSAKTALTTFVNLLDPGPEKDKAGLVSFPGEEKLLSYWDRYYACPYVGPGNEWHYATYWAKIQKEMTNDFSGIIEEIDGLSTSFGTPVANGIKQGSSLLPEPPDDSDRVRAMIIATDGIANVKLDGVLDYCSFSDPDELLGEHPVQQSEDEAETAKAEGIIIFVVGLGGNVNTSTLQAIASKDANGDPYYYYAASEEDLVDIYRTIEEIISSLNPIVVCPGGYQGE